VILFFRQVIASLLLSLLVIGATNISGLLPNQTKLNSGDISHHIQCIKYDSTQKLIDVRCKSIHLTDIYNQLSNSSILGIENSNDGYNSSLKNGKVWILHAGIVVGKEGSLIIDSSDTSWLKITSTPTLQLKQVASNITDKEEGNNSKPTEQTHIDTDTENSTSNTEGNNIIIVSKNNADSPNGIHVHGSLKIDSVKITSWDPEKNDVIKLAFGKRGGEEHTKSDYDTAEPRAFIRISKLANGTTNITNSELAYLGYSCSRCSGLSYYGGEGSIIKRNDIHHLLKGFYSKNTGHLIIDSNKFHDNYLYGIDPHTGSHDMVITDNLVYNNNASGIICSKDCYNLLIEGNEVYNNTGAARGIAFSINTTHSVAKNNYIHDQPRCISFNRGSDHNAVYNNTISNCKTGVNLANTGNNSIYNNTISSTQNGITVENVKNKIYNNKISLTKYGIVFELPPSNRTNNFVSANSTTTDNYHNSYPIEILDENHFSDTKNLLVLKKQPLNRIEVEEPNEKNSTSALDN
jgi:poly(beta-D-mannuronate) C5 epimerase